MKKLLKIKSSYFRPLIFMFCFVLAMFFLNCINVKAYGEKIKGFQTHYEVQNQYRKGSNLIIEGFYFVLYLQNYTSSEKKKGTHYYKLELNNGKEKKTYYDTGKYYIDLTSLERKQGASWVSKGESDVVNPNLSHLNYRYKDVGFQFKIPISDLEDFQGEKTKWSLKISLVATNTYKGKGVEWEFKQSKIYASKIFDSFEYKDNIIKPNTSLGNNSSVVSADYAFVRTGPGTDTKRAKYKGEYLFWGTNKRFYDLSVSKRINNGSEKLTWYKLSYGNIYYKNCYRVAYLKNSKNVGWIPSVFLGTVSGTPYYIEVINIPPEINASNIEVNEGTKISKKLLLKNVTAYDYSTGKTKPEIIDTDLQLDSVKNPVGEYYVTYKVTDSRSLSTTKKIKVTIKNVLPELTVKDTLYFDYGQEINDATLMEALIEAYDVFDGDLKDEVYIKSYGDLKNDITSNKYGDYEFTMAVKDSNNEESLATVKVKISYKYIRAINSKFLDSIKENSKWKNPSLKLKLNNSFEKKNVKEWKYNQEKRKLIKGKE